MAIYEENYESFESEVVLGKRRASFAKVTTVKDAGGKVLSETIEVLWNTSKEELVAKLDAEKQLFESIVARKQSTKEALEAPIVKEIEGGR